MRAVALLVLVLVTASVGWIVRGYWQSRSSVSSAEAPGTATAKVMRGRIDQTVRARGIVKPAPNALVRIGFPMPKDVSRRIRTLRVVEGDAVTAGTLLGELDTSDLTATLQQLRGDADRRAEAAGGPAHPGAARRSSRRNGARSGGRTG